MLGADNGNLMKTSLNRASSVMVLATVDETTGVLERNTCDRGGVGWGREGLG